VTLGTVYSLGIGTNFNISLHIPDITNITQKKYVNIESRLWRYAV